MTDTEQPDVSFGVEALAESMSTPPPPPASGPSRHPTRTLRGGIGGSTVHLDALSDAIASVTQVQRSLQSVYENIEVLRRAAEAPLAAFTMSPLEDLARSQSALMRAAEVATGAGLVPQ